MSKKIDLLLKATDHETAALEFHEYLRPIVKDWIELQTAVGSLPADWNKWDWKYAGVDTNYLYLKYGDKALSVSMQFIEDQKAYREKALTQYENNIHFHQISHYNAKVKSLTELEESLAVLRRAEAQEAAKNV